VKYPLEPESIGSDTYIVISRGHHDIHEFVRAVRKTFSWPLGTPEHIWMKTVPSRDPMYRCWYQPVPKGTRGAWPATYVAEAYNEDCYERVFSKELAP
jgi:hypothetical protein